MSKIVHMFDDTYFEDMLGRKVRVGDYIVYPGRQSSSVWQNVGRVVAMENKPHPWRDGVTEATVTVRGAERYWRDGKIRPKTKNGFLTVLSRIVKIDNIPIEVKEVFEDAS